MLFDLDELVLGAKPAEAIRAHLERAIKSISEFASDATQAMRKKAAGAFASGATWALKRYSGGRTGAKPPNQTARLFNDSGRLAEGWFVRENKEDRGWTVNVPANRLDPSTFTGEGFQRMLDKLRSLVPVLQDVRELNRDDVFNRTVSESVRDIATKGEMGGNAATVAKLKQLAAARKAARLAFVRLGRTVLGV